MRLDPNPRYIAQVLAMALCIAFQSHAQQSGGTSGKGGEQPRVLARSANALVTTPGPQSSSRVLTRCPETRTASRDSQGGPPAQAGPVAWMRDHEGNSLASVESGLVSGGEGLLMNEYTRILTTGNGKLVVSYCDGCDVRLEPNQRLEVRLGRSCAARQLDVKSILIESVVIGSVTAPFASAALAGSLQAGGLALGGLGGGIAIVRDREGEVVSPN